MSTNAKQNADFLEAGRKLFAGPCQFIFAAARAEALAPI
jgi:hypothetical protein